MSPHKKVIGTNTQAKVIPRVGQETNGKNGTPNTLVIKTLARKNQGGDGTNSLVTNSNVLASKDQADDLEIQISGLESELFSELTKMAKLKIKQLNKFLEEREALILSVSTSIESKDRAIEAVNNALDLVQQQLLSNMKNPTLRERNRVLVRLLLEELRISRLELSSIWRKFEQQEFQQFTNVVEELEALGRRLDAFLEDRKSAIEGLRASVKRVTEDENNCIEIGGIVLSMNSFELFFNELEMMESLLSARKLGLGCSNPVQNAVLVAADNPPPEEPAAQ